MDMFRVWATACSHVHSDLKSGRRSLADAIAHSEFGGEEGGPPFDWDILLHLGDISGTQAPPTDTDGPPVVEQLASAKKHRIEQIYHLIGNHDGRAGRGDAMVVPEMDRRGRDQSAILADAQGTQTLSGRWNMGAVQLYGGQHTFSHDQRPQ
jgi:hypothetical protein